MRTSGMWAHTVLCFRLQACNTAFLCCCGGQLFLLLWLSIPSGFLVVFEKPNRSSSTFTFTFSGRPAKPAHVLDHAPGPACGAALPPKQLPDREDPAAGRAGKCSCDVRFVAAGSLYVLVNFSCTHTPHTPAALTGHRPGRPTARVHRSPAQCLPSQLRALAGLDARECSAPTHP
jgi:hypothetical protein